MLMASQIIGADTKSIERLLKSTLQPFAKW
jgi:hypothetical protein